MPAVHLRTLQDSDLDTLFADQADPEAAAMAGFPSRDRARFDAHWAKIRGDDAVILRTVVADGAVAGGVTSWLGDEGRLVGYWIGRSCWGQGVATAALTLFVAEVEVRPLLAYVAVHNVGSIRVLEKCGFRAGLSADPEEFRFVLDS
jgi:RimJ/RimL family protein N-acetyltransferase